MLKVRIIGMQVFWSRYFHFWCVQQIIDQLHGIGQRFNRFQVIVFLCGGRYGIICNTQSSQFGYQFIITIFEFKMMQCTSVLMKCSPPNTGVIRKRYAFTKIMWPYYFDARTISEKNHHLLLILWIHLFWKLCEWCAIWKTEARHDPLLNVKTCENFDNTDYLLIEDVAACEQWQLNFACRARNLIFRPRFRIAAKIHELFSWEDNWRKIM